MKEISLKEYQKIYIDKFAQLISFLDENNLPYSLAYGTMLGAVREGNIIPWDYDIDIFMYESDVKKLISIQNKIPQQFYLTSYYDNEEVFGEVRVYLTEICRKDLNRDYQDANIDIFIVDNFASQKDMIMCGKKLKKIYKNVCFGMSRTKPKNIIKRFLKKILQLFCLSLKKSNILSKKALDKVKKGNKYLGTYFYGYMLKPCSIPSGYKIMKFGGYSFSVYDNFHEMLSKAYGDDYLTPRIDLDPSLVRFYRK